MKEFAPDHGSGQKTVRSPRRWTCSTATVLEKPFAEQQNFRSGSALHFVDAQRSTRPTDGSGRKSVARRLQPDGICSCNHALVTGYKKSKETLIKYRNFTRQRCNSLTCKATEFSKTT